MKKEMIDSAIREYLSDLEAQIKNLSLQKVHKVLDILHQAYKKGRNIYVIGNGGSATTAMHFSCDLGKGTIKNYNDKKEKRFRVFPLTGNIATMTAIANDIGYDEVFSQQLLNLMAKGDVLIAISASGNSKNILNAVKVAKEAGVIAIGLTGFDGGKLKDVANHSIVVKSNKYGVVEDLHLILNHIIHYCFRKIKD